jgi:hypothetical protein
MIKNKSAILGSVVLSLMLGGCAITTTVKPLANAKVSPLCIKKNPKVLMDGFLPELESQISSYGITTRSFVETLPIECVRSLEYTANWRWDMAMYLSYAELKIYENTTLIGEAVYDARSGSGRLDKFGTTAEKLKTLTEPLFNQQSRESK